MEAFENVAPDSSRNLVRVQWSSGKGNSYRLGFHGNVDLKCVEEEVGPFYYRDHLPLLGELFYRDHLSVIGELFYRDHLLVLGELFCRVHVSVLGEL